MEFLVGRDIGVWHNRSKRLTLSFLLGVVILLTGPFPRPRFVPDKKAFDCMFFAICFAPSPAINPLGFSFSTLTAGATVVRNDMSRGLSWCVLYRVFFGSPYNLDTNFFEIIQQKRPRNSCFPIACQQTILPIFSI